MREHTSTRPPQYPYNLLQTVQRNTDLSLPTTLTRDHLAGLHYALFTLPAISQKWIHLHFEQNLVQDDINKILSLTAPEVESLALSTIRKLRHSSRWNWICYGIEGNTKRLLTQTRADSYRQGYFKGLEDGNANQDPKAPEPELLSLPIQSIPLPSRIYNTLMRNGFSNLGELAALSKYQIISIQGLGTKNRGVLARALTELGLSGTTWEQFLRP